MEFATIATVLVALFVAYLAFLFVQFVYVVISRKALVDRRTCPDDGLPLPERTVVATSSPAAGSISPTQIKDFLRSAWKNKTASLSSKALKKAAEAAAVASPTPPTPPPSAVVVQAAAPPTDEEVEEMLMGGRLRGPPRFLFTIKEEEREGSAADTASFEENNSGSVRINKEFTGTAPYYGDNSDEEVSSPVIGVVVELNQLRAPFGSPNGGCSRLHTAEEADTGGVVIPRIVLAP